MTRAQKTWLHLCIAALLVTGLLYLPNYLERMTELEIPAFWFSIPATKLMLLHAAAAFVLLPLLGGIWQTHIRQKLRRGRCNRRNRRSGITLIVLLAALTVSGYWLYYAATREAREITGLLHTFLGLPLLPLLLWHARAARRKQE